MSTEPPIKRIMQLLNVAKDVQINVELPYRDIVELVKHVEKLEEFVNMFIEAQSFGWLERIFATDALIYKWKDESEVK